MSVRSKLLATCSMLVLLLSISAVAQAWFAREAGIQDAASNREHLKVAHLFDLEAGLVWQMKESLDVRLGEEADDEPGDAETDDAYELDQARARVRSALAALRASVSADDRLEGELRVLSRLAEELDVETSKLLSGASNLASHEKLEGRFRKAFLLTETMLEGQKDDVIAQDLAAAQWRSRTVTVAWLMPLLVLLILGALSWSVLRAIMGPLEDLREGAARVARAALDTPVNVRADDELGRLAAAFNDMQASLKARIEERDLARLESARKSERLTAIETFRALSEAAPVGILEVDAEGSSLYRNTRFVDLFGGELVGDRRWMEVLHEEDRATIDRLIRDPGCSAELRVGRGEHLRWVIAQAALLQDDTKRIITFSEITAQKKAIAESEKLTRELVSASRRAGMAEISSGVLHNVGNVLNSVNVSAVTLRELLSASRPQKLARAVNLLEEHAGDLFAFLSSEQGKKLPGYLVLATSQLVDQNALARDHLERIEKGVEHIKAIVATQQSYAGAGGQIERLRMSAVIEDVLRLNAVSFDRHAIELVKMYEADPEIDSDRHKIMQVLMNLINNARQALNSAELTASKKLQISTRITPDRRLCIEVSDNGAGISSQNMAHIFQHGFTTKESGHGFGLHASALAAQDLGGVLRASSQGPNLGATFVLELPLDGRPRTLESSRSSGAPVNGQARSVAQAFESLSR